MESLVAAFQNPIMQSMVIGPLMGVIFGAIFSSLTKPPPSHVPETVTQTRRVYITHTTVQRNASNESDGIVILIALVLAMLFIVWKYAVLESQIHYYVGLVLLGAISFSFTTIAISWLKGQLTSGGWWSFLLTSIIFQCICVYMWYLAGSSFSTSITQTAGRYNFVEFYTKALSEYGRNYMLSHVIGVISFCIVAVFCFLSLLHYMALMSQRSSGIMSKLWYFTAGATMFFSSVSWLVASAVLLVVSYLCLEPTLVAQWLTKR